MGDIPFDPVRESEIMECFSLKAVDFGKKGHDFRVEVMSSQRRVRQVGNG
jgi:hypothetical protein